MDIPVQLTHATPEDCETLAAFAAACFTDTFGHLYHPEDLASHLQNSSTPDYFAKALGAGDTILLAHSAEKLIAYAKAYAKFGDVTLPATDIPAGAQELHRFYIDRQFQGQGIGKWLMDQLLTHPRLANATRLYLSVWEDNLRAQKLYGSYGFTVIGECAYPVGNHVDRDLIMMR